MRIERLGRLVLFVVVAACCAGAAAPQAPGQASTTQTAAPAPGAPTVIPVPGPAAPGAPKPTPGAPASSLVLDFANAPTIETVVPLPDDGRVPMRVFVDPTAQTPYHVLASGLQDSEGHVVQADVSIDDKTFGPDATATQTDGLLKFTLRIAPVPAAGHVGALLTVVGGAQHPTWRLALVRGLTRPASIAVDALAPSRPVECPWIGCWGELDAVTVRVRDKSGAWPLDNVGARVEQVTKAGGAFDAAENLTFAFNGKPIADFLTVDASPRPDRSVPARGQGNVRIGIKDLAPGEYNATLRFVALNSIEEDPGRVTLSFAVKHSWVPALAMLLLGLLISFFGTKYVSAVRQRLAIRSRINGLNTAWLREELPTSPVVWAQATLSLAQDATDAAWLTVPSQVEERLAQVEALLPVLHRQRLVRIALTDAAAGEAVPPFVAARGYGILDVVTGKCGEPPVDVGVLASVQTTLQGFDQWLPPSDWTAAYWADVAGAIRSFLQDVRPTDLPAGDGRDVVAQFSQDLAPFKVAGAPPPDNPVVVERKYATLKVLWERRRAAEFPDLVAAARTGTLEDVFKVADDSAWARIKDAIAGGKAHIRVSTTSPQAYEPFTLSVRLDDASLEQTFLFRHRLNFSWTIEKAAAERTAPDPRTQPAAESGEAAPEAKPKKKEKSNPFVLTPESLQPSIVQYAPGAITIGASVVVSHVGDRAQVLTSDPITIKASSELGIFRKFNGLDVTSAFVIGLTAVATGLSTFYAKSPTFGSLADYVTLFLWALAFDQSRNTIVQMAKPAGAP